MGTPCTNAAQCGDTTTEICDPYTLTCAPGECDTNMANCPANQACLGQVSMANVGACYNSCTAFSASSGCTAGQYCLSINNATTDGACFGVGTTPLNMTCTPSAVSTGCVSGAVCANDGPVMSVCRKTCDFWNSPAGCGAGERCDAGNICSSQTPDPAAIGGTCAASATSGAGCAATSSAVTGVCYNPTGTGTALTCGKWCRLGSNNDCAAGQTCTDVMVQDVGVCQ